LAALSGRREPPLPEELEAELEAIRADPGESVGFGEKAFIPYEPNVARWLVTSDDPAVTERLLAEATGDRDRVFRLAVLQVLGKRSDPAVDAALMTTLEDPELRATSAYLLGRPGYKGYPERPRDGQAIRAALRRHLDDDGTFDDPFYRRTFRTQDFVLAAFVRVTGPERFRIPDTAFADLIGYTLPEFDAETRADLLAQAKRS
jgi:hypothetical protein